MSGHSKWATIKRKKGETDAKRANIFTKLGREIAVAVKQGGADPDTNSRLRDAIAKAKSSNMPNDNIMRSIKKASGDMNGVDYEAMTYEGYGAGGVAVIVEALTDNKNRTASDVRHAFDKNGGSLGTTGCVSYMFEKKGLIVVVMEGQDEDDIMMQALDAGADDVLFEDGAAEIYTAPANFSEVRENIEKLSLNIASAEIDFVPANYVKPDAGCEGKILKLLDMLEDLDDVQNVYHNAELSED